MNLVRAGGTIFMGGHDVFAESTDGGKTWRAMRPAGLPSLDVHGLTVDPRDHKTLYAQIAMTGLLGLFVILRGQRPDPLDATPAAQGLIDRIDRFGRE